MSGVQHRTPSKVVFDVKLFLMHEMYIKFLPGLNAGHTSVLALF